MCGIAGSVAAAGRPPDVEAVERMVAALHHRGPDDRGVEVLDGVALGATRLAIIDPTPTGRQPLAIDDGAWWIAYNGEVFNHEQLRAELPARVWRGRSDTESLLAALAAWDVGALGRLNGFFAFAALDRDRRRLLLARDRFGVKPLYWARHAGCLWFASEIRALLAAGVPAIADPDVLVHSVALGWANGPATPLAGIRRLLPGTVLEVGLDGLTLSERQWTSPLTAIDADRARELAALPADARAVQVEDALRTAVRRRLLADVPVGVMTSGGLDSSLLTQLAADEHPMIDAFTAALPDQPEWDEREWAERVAGHAGVRLHVVETSAPAWREDLVETVLHNEYPLLHPSSVPMAQIARSARAAGMKALLSGEGADELFGGYPWVTTAEAADFRARRRPHERAARKVWRALQRRGLAPGLREWPPHGPSEEANRYQDAVAAAALAARSSGRGERRRYAAALDTLASLYLPHLLNRQDKATMQHSIETREPYLDNDLVALAVNLPLDAKTEPALKQPLREVAARLLPPQVVTRAKVGFGMDVQRLLEGHVRLEFLSDGRLRELLGERFGPLTEVEPLRIWTAEIWARLFLDGARPDAVAAELWR